MLKLCFWLLLFICLFSKATCQAVTSIKLGSSCTNPSSCLYQNDCVSDGTEDICICRKQRILENAANSAKCNADFSPLGLSPLEGGYPLDAITTSFESLPNANFEASDETPSKAAHNARLNSSSAWCLPFTTPIPMYLQIDLVVPSVIRMIASKGGGESSVRVRNFNLQVGNSISALQMVVDVDNISTSFVTANLYHILVQPINGRYLRILPQQKDTMYCLQLELYGTRTLNECSFPAPVNHCHVNRTTCTDSVASYNCRCAVGYHDVKGDGSICDLVNECSDSRQGHKHNCSQHATCTDKPVGFQCTCNQGYLGDGYYCEDVNECLAGRSVHKCHVKANCNNTEGSWFCECKNGYKGTGNIICKNINECKTGTHKCHSDAVCTDTIGSYSCRCRGGYIGSGFKCKDINECDASQSCHKNARCTNKAGQYQCQCLNGFNGNGKWCQDVNECLKNPCKYGEQCHNLVGNYTCMCPSFMPLQDEYAAKIERTIFDEVVTNFRDISKEDYRYPIDYHAHIVRTIYQLLMRTYDYHFEENRYSFSVVKVIGNSFAIELYDVRCKDIKTAYFPNLCHKAYHKTIFDNTTDIVEMPLNEFQNVPFEHWATAPPPKPPQIGDTTPTPPPLITPGMASNDTNATTTVKTFPDKYLCPTVVFQQKIQSTGEFSTPNFDEVNPKNYPKNAKCVWKMVAQPRHNAYVEFDMKHFETEYDRKCLNDYVEIRDGNEDGPVLATYCGRQYATAVRSTRTNLTVIFYSDYYYEYKGFKAKFYFLTTRVSLGCISYNPMASLPKSKLKVWDREMESQDPSIYVPVSRLLACQQHPKCDEHKELYKPLQFTFEHFRFDRNDKKCIRWTLLKFGRSYDTYDCWKIKTNKTHTVCQCKSWGIVGVLGRLTNFDPPPPLKQFNFGSNSFVSVLFVVLALLVTLVFLFLKDQWGAVIIQVFTMKEYDSGRVIQLHIVLSTLLAEIFFSIITFNVTGSLASCFILGFLFYYFLQTVFFWLFIYTLFLASRVQEIFDSNKFNSYKIYLIVGYVLPFLVTLTISGLDVLTGETVKEKLCWLLFRGTTVWGFSGVIITLGMGSLILLFKTLYNAQGTKDGIVLQEKCLRTVFTTFFVLLTTIFGAQVLKEQTFAWEYLFALCNLLQGFSIVVMYCILRREDPIIKSNQIGPIPDFGDDATAKVIDDDDIPQFKDMEGELSESDDEDIPKSNEDVRGGSNSIDNTPSSAIKIEIGDSKLHMEQENQETMVDQQEPWRSDSDEDQEIMFRTADDSM